MEKKELLKLAEDVRREGITTSAHKYLLKKASEIKIVSLLAVINR